jgi:prophage antirepressor-like protein
MTNELRVFNFEGAAVRAVMKDGEPWWVLKDVCDVLGIANSRDVATRLDEDEKADVDLTDTSSNGVIQNRMMLAVNESGLYNVILRSDKPNAKTFKRWVTHEVLPEIRKNGGYMVDNPNETGDELLARSHEIALRVLARREERIRELQTTISIKDQQLIEMKPKASYYDVILNAKDAISVTKIAKDYGKSAIWLNEYLHNKGVQFKQGDIWLLYAKHAEQGYTCTKTHLHPAPNGEIHSKIHTYWTQKGRLFLYELLKKDGVLPLIEQERPAA